MEVRELIVLLEALPQEAWVDAMFPDLSDAYAVTGVDTFEVSGGRTIAVIDITAGPALVTA